MAGDDLVGNRRRERLEDSVDDRHRVSHPPAHRRRLDRAHHLPRREDDLERAEAAVVDRQVERGREALERDLRARTPGGLAGVVEAAHLVAHAAQVDGHPVVRDGDLHPDRHAAAGVDAVVVQERLGLVDAVGDRAHALARGRLALVHDGADAAQHGVAAVLRQELEEALLAGAHRRDLRAQVAHRALGDADVHADDPDEVLVERRRRDRTSRSASAGLRRRCPRSCRRARRRCPASAPCRRRSRAARPPRRPAPRTSCGSGGCR